jgi:hypothetical protein
MGPDAAKPAQKHRLTAAENSASQPVAGQIENPPEGSDSGIMKVPVDGKSIYRRYSELQHENFKLRRLLSEMQSPTRTPEQMERQLAGIRAFFASMNDSEGAVTAANLYGSAYFKTEQDSKFRVALLDFLLGKFSGAEPLIVPTYNYWVSLHDKEKAI